MTVGLSILAPILTSLVAVSQTERPTEHIRLKSEAVILDAVVHDNKGRLIKDLTADDFRVFENGVEQEVRSVRLVDGSQPASTLDVARDYDALDPGFTSPTENVHLIALLFDSLDIESRRYAREAAEDLLETDLPHNTFIGVFAIEKGLRALSPYTTDFDRVREAVALATSGRFGELHARSKELHEQALRATQSMGNLYPEGSTLADKLQSGPAADSNENTRRVVESYLLLDILDRAPSLETELHGLTVLEGMKALVSAHRGMPGRKTVLFYSEGLYLQERYVYLFRNLISEANLANVSIYAVDARGLTSQGQTRAGAAALGRASALSREQVQSAAVGGQAAGGGGPTGAQLQNRSAGGVSAEQVRALETAEDSIRMNVQEALEDLSRSTGGFVTANTNDAQSAMKRLSADIQQYYEIVYIPEADPSDPRYRKIQIEIDRDSASVQTRDGYFPLPRSADGPSKGYEVPLLASLKGPDLPRDFPLTSRAFHFAPKTDKVEEVLIAAVPFESLELEVDESTQLYSAHLSILALVKDKDGSVVFKKSQDYPLQGSLADLEVSQKSDVVFMGGLRLPPGRYHLEVAAYDHLSRKTSTKRQVLVVTQPTEGVSMSSLLLIGGVEPLSGTEQLLYSPLKHGDHRVMPKLDKTIDLSAEAEIAFYCTVYPSEEIAAGPELTVGMYKDGQLVFRGSPELVDADREGQLAGMFAIPTEGLTPGTYQLRAWARQGETVATESVVFTVASKD
jgi:VWFA-related protein